MLFTALAGMYLATPLSPPIGLALTALLGIGLASCSAAVLNQIADHRVDRIMQRTQHRPLPSGYLTARQLSIFAFIIGASGIGLLWIWVNPLTASLTAFAMLGYAWIYTRYLKYATPQNIVIGGIAGAFPPLLGWTAVTNRVDAMALVLFLIVFVWTPPHFWSLSLYHKHEYRKAGIPMLPVTYGNSFTKSYILLYTLLLFPATMLPFIIGASGLVYLVCALVLTSVMLFYTISLKLYGGDKRANRTFRFSIIYLAFLFFSLILDRYLTLTL